LDRGALILGVRCNARPTPACGGDANRFDEPYQLRTNGMTIAQPDGAFS
jgi:hypothetical protein